MGWHREKSLSRPIELWNAKASFSILPPALRRHSRERGNPETDNAEALFSMRSVISVVKSNSPQRTRRPQRRIPRPRLRLQFFWPLEA